MKSQMRKPSEIISEIRAQLPPHVELVAISKYHPASLIEEAYGGGQRVFGESHVQELQEKHESLPKDIQWHFIGHLQTNKVKYLAPYISLIHAVDSHRLLMEINRQAERCGRVIDCLLQVHIAQEETKFGFSPEELLQYMEEGAWRALSHVSIRGLMCMASNVDDEAQIAREFSQAADIFQQLKNGYFPESDTFSIRSWGMSDDYHIALLHGSNMIRIGSKIFGPR